MYKHKLCLYTDYRGSVYVLSSANKWYATLRTDSFPSDCITPYPFKDRGKQLNQTIEYVSIDTAYFVLFIYRTKDGKVQKIIANLVSNGVKRLTPEIVNAAMQNIQTDTHKVEVACIQIKKDRMDICMHDKVNF